MICNQGLSAGPTRDGDVWEATCPRCGVYQFTNVVAMSPITPGDLWPFLSAATRQASEAGSIATIDGNWRSLADSHSKTSATQMIERVLLYIGSRTRPGQPWNPVEPEINFPLFDMKSGSELVYVLEQLQETKYLTLGPGGLGWMLTAKGWEHLTTKAGTFTPGTCFVAMSFDESLSEAYTEGIKPALEEDCGFKSIRIDRVEHNEKICDRILAEVRQCQFIVADFTLHRAGVYFEAGFAMGLGRPVIWTVRKDGLPKTHFDTRQYNHIDWAQPSDLRKRLAERVQATIGKFEIRQ
jgi:nucleoside 2-deoxyribosyltransferase